MADLSKELAAVLRVDTGLQTPPTTPRERVPYEDLLAYTSEWPAAQGANSIQVMMLENALGLDPGSPAPASPEPEPVYDALAGVYPWERAVSVPAPVFDLGAAGAPPVATAGLPLTPPPTLGRRARVWRPRLAWPHGRRFAKAPVKKTRKDVSASKKEALRKSLDLARRLREPSTAFPQVVSLEITSPGARRTALDGCGADAPSMHITMPQSEANRSADETGSM